jgi:hypothetical protein
MLLHAQQGRPTEADRRCCSLFFQIIIEASSQIFCAVL